MILKRVTFTGVDDFTDFSRLHDLSVKYGSLVEWGVLLSLTKSGKEARYPSVSTMHRLKKLPCYVSVHLCGELARDYAEGRNFPCETALQLCDPDRIQINLGKQIDLYPLIFTRDVFPVSLILQVYDVKSRVIQSGKLSSSYFLHDASGGRGVYPTSFQPPINQDFVGYAGGITPENVLKTLDTIEKFDAPNLYWIDIESGVRTNDRFDLDKVETILESVTRRQS